MANPWFRLYSEFEDDPKVQMMSEADQRRLVMLFCQRCKEQKRTDSQQSFKWRVSLDELARTKAVFLANGFIDEDWNILNWDKRQFLSDSSTERVRRYRSARKQDETLLKQDETLLKRDETLDVTNRNGVEERRTEQIHNRGEESRRLPAKGKVNGNGEFSSLGTIIHALVPPAPLPQTKSEMIAAGWEFSNKRDCKNCGADLEWWTSRTGKQAPVLAATGELHLGPCAAAAKVAK